MTRTLEDLPATTPAPRRSLLGISRTEAAVVGAAAAVLVVVFVALAAAHGALGASRNDDWVYYRAAFRFADGGTFSADPWSMAMLVGLVLLAQPFIAVFGHSIVALQLLVAVLAGVGLWAAYVVVRSILSPRWSAFSVGCLALGPVYGGLSVTFMTDVPAFCFEMLALLTALIALRAKSFSLAWFSVSLAIGLFAFSIREYAVAGTAAIAVAAFFRARSESKRLGWLVAGLVGLWFVVAVALYRWRSGLVDSAGVEVMLVPSKWNVSVLRRTAFTMALFAIPLVPLLSFPRLLAKVWAHKWMAAGAAVLAVLVGVQFVKARPDGSLVGNYLQPDGPYYVTLAGTPPTVIPAALWQVLAVLSLVGFLALLLVATVRVGALVRSGLATRSRPAMPQDWGRTLIFLFCVAATAILAAIKLFTTAPLFDRYLIPIIPFVIALAVRAAIDHELIVAPKRAVAALSLGVFAVFGIGMVDTAATFDGVKWRLAESVEAKGYPARAIDGGYEWYGYHQPGAITPLGTPIPGRNFWIGLFDDRTVCVTDQFSGPPTVHPAAGEPVVISERTGRSLLGVEYHMIAVAGPQSCQPDGGGK